MSHVATIQAQIKSLTALQRACDRMGWELCLNQKTYKWFGKHVGDYPMPEGLTRDDLGKCDHAIKVPGCRYEIGIIEDPNNSEQMIPIWDFWDRQLKEAMGGETAWKFVHAYSIEQEKLTSEIQGHIFEETVMEDRIRTEIIIG